MKRINRNQFDESAKVKKKRKIWFFSHVSWSMFFFWIVVCQIPKGSPPVVGALPYYMKMEGANQLSRSQTCRTLQQRVTDLKTIRICQKITYNSHLKKLKTPKKCVETTRVTVIFDTGIHIRIMSNGHRVDRLKIVMHNRFAWTKRWAYRIKAYAKQWRNSGRKIVWTVNSRLGFSASILHEKKNTLSGNKLGLEWPKSYIFF